MYRPKKKKKKKKKKNRKEYLAQQLNALKNSCSKNYRETSLF